MLRQNLLSEGVFFFRLQGSYCVMPLSSPQTCVGQKMGVRVSVLLVLPTLLSLSPRRVPPLTTVDKKLSLNSDFRISCFLIQSKGVFGRAVFSASFYKSGALQELQKSRSESPQYNTCST